MTERLYTFADLAEKIPLSPRTLRDILAELGYRAKRGRLLFTADQVAHIVGEVACPSPLLRLRYAAGT